MGNNSQNTANSTLGQVVWDYPDTALESARKYYSYLESENKGVAVFTVEKVENGMLPGHFQFYLDKRPFGVDSLGIWINDVPLKENQGKVVELVSNSRVISVWK